MFAASLKMTLSAIVATLVVTIMFLILILAAASCIKMSIQDKFIDESDY